MSIHKLSIFGISWTGKGIKYFLLFSGQSNIHYNNPILSKNEKAIYCDVIQGLWVVQNTLIWNNHILYCSFSK